MATSRSKFVRFEISIGRATSNLITGHTTPAEAVEDIRTGKWSKPIAAPRLPLAELVSIRHNQDKFCANMHHRLTSIVAAILAADGYLRFSQC